VARQNRCFVFRLDGVTAAFDRRNSLHCPISRQSAV
jgi:hypothetical protein